MQPANNFRYRCLEAGEVDSIWSIDRAEKISAVYYMQENQLTLKQECYNLQTWPLGEPETYAAAAPGLSSARRLVPGRI